MRLGYRLYILRRLLFLNFYRATHASLMQNESYQQIPKKTKNNGEHEKRDNINT